MFVLTAAEILVSIGLGHRKGPYAVGHLLHLTMSVAMAAMAWPGVAALTARGASTGAMVFFLLAAVWFVAVVITGAGSRIVNSYSALMMVAMAWMYAVMCGRIGMSGMDMDDMDMDGMSGMEASSSHGGQPEWVGAVNWFWTVFFAAAAVCWIGRYVSLCRTAPADSRHLSLDAAWQAMMATGMAVMFGVMR